MSASTSLPASASSSAWKALSAASLDRFGDGVGLGLELREIAGSHPDQLAEGRGFELHAHLEDAAQLVQRGIDDPEAAIAHRLEQPVGCELQQGLADRRGRDAQRARQGGHGADRARRHLARDDLDAELMDDLFAQIGVA
jgi:hypothetical protein